MKRIDVEKLKAGDEITVIPSRMFMKSPEYKAVFVKITKSGLVEHKYAGDNQNRLCPMSAIE